METSLLHLSSKNWHGCSWDQGCTLTILFRVKWLRKVATLGIFVWKKEFHRKHTVCWTLLQWMHQIWELWPLSLLCIDLLKYFRTSCLICPCEDKLCRAKSLSLKKKKKPNSVFTCFNIWTSLDVRCLALIFGFLIRVKRTSYIQYLFLPSLAPVLAKPIQTSSS